MKKKILLITTILVAAFITFASFKFTSKEVQPSKERVYTLTIPEHLINPVWQIVNGNQKELKVGEYTEALDTLSTQILSQSKLYHIQDSITYTHYIDSIRAKQAKDTADAKKKVDSTKLKK